MKSAFVFLFTLLSLLAPAHASAFGIGSRNKIKQGNSYRAGLNKILVQEKRSDDQFGIDNNDLNKDTTDGEVLDNDDYNNENNNNNAGRKRANTACFQASNNPFVKTNIAATRRIISTKHYIVPAGTPVIIFISQFRL